MKKAFFILIILSLVFINNELLYSTNKKPIIEISRSGGGGTIWNLWGEYYAQVDEYHNPNTNTHKLTCTGNGNLKCRWLNPPPKPTSCISIQNLYDDMENYAGNQIQSGNLTGTYNDIVNCGGDLYLRTVQWDGQDINNNNIVITVERYNVPN